MSRACDAMNVSPVTSVTSPSDLPRPGAPRWAHDREWPVPEKGLRSPVRKRHMEAAAIALVPLIAGDNAAKA